VNSNGSLIPDLRGKPPTPSKGEKEQSLSDSDYARMLQEEWEKEVTTPPKDTPATLRDSDFARRLYEEESARDKPKVDDFEAVIDIIKSDAKIEADEKIGKRILLLCEYLLILSLPSSPVTPPLPNNSQSTAGKRGPGTTA